MGRGSQETRPAHRSWSRWSIYHHWWCRWGKHEVKAIVVCVMRSCGLTSLRVLCQSALKACDTDFGSSTGTAATVAACRHYSHSSSTQRVNEPFSTTRWVVVPSSPFLYCLATPWTYDSPSGTQIEFCNIVSATRATVRNTLITCLFCG